MIQESASHSPRSSRSPRATRAITYLGLLVLLLLSAPGVMAAPRSGPVVPSTAAGPVHLILILRNQASPSLSTAGKIPDRPGRMRQVELALQAQAQASQPDLLLRLEGLRTAGDVVSFRPMWLVNAIAVTARPEAAARLGQLPGVVQVAEDRPVRPAEPAPLADSMAPASSLYGPAANLAQVLVPQFWATGYQGQGVVVANLDTGVSLNNPDLAAKWRGGENSWYDVHGQHRSPVDQAAGNTGHGTATMSIMVGTNTGMAPRAEWLAVKLFDDEGKAEISDAIAGLEWVLDPDRNPDTPDAPQVVNNSWTDTIGCLDTNDTEGPFSPALHLALQHLLAAGILPIFSAGNYARYVAPDRPSDTSPGNFPEAFAVGAIDAYNNVAGFSSRGPSSCTGKPVFPDIAAPGVQVPVQGLSGEITYADGTSFSAPHVAGAAALLLSAFPKLTAEEQRQALQNGAIDTGPAGVDNQYGYGRLDMLNTYLRLGGKPPNLYYLPEIY